MLSDAQWDELELLIEECRPKGCKRSVKGRPVRVLPVPGASTGIGVSSPCRTAEPAITLGRRQRRRGPGGGRPDEAALLQALGE